MWYNYNFKNIKIYIVFNLIDKSRKCETIHNMNQSVVSEKAAEHVKNIIDSNRCAVCDKLNGKRMRYPCGHTSCDDCVPATECCPFCLTPQDSDTFAVPSIDSPYAHRCQKASNLLEAFQNEFGVDVYRRQRLSEQLKAEKEVFPQCIQAPAKYYNKRKSLKPYAENKENIISVFPGEILSPIKMENSNANVREWLNKCVKRKPLGDLNNSRTLINTIRKQPLKKINTQNVDRNNRKRNYLDIWADDKKTSTDDQVKTKKYNKKNTIKKLEIKIDSTDPKRMKNKDDSGVSMDDDGAIIIDDSQSIRVDKDMNAWLAVLEAEKNKQCASTLTSESTTHELTQPKLPLKVPFYLKGPLCYNCEYNNVNTLNKDVETEDQPNISITVESKNFTAIINVSKSEKCNKINTKQSVEVQTEFNSSDGFVDQGFVDEKCLSFEKDELRAISPIPSSSKSEVIILDEAHNVGLVNKSGKSANVIIAESDSDEETHSLSLVVTADVHRSHEEILVLDDIEDLQEHSKRPRRAARGYTPTSTDSSDKENYNPNRMKKSFNSKKKPVKK